MREWEKYLREHGATDKQIAKAKKNISETTYITWIKINGEYINAADLPADIVNKIMVELNARALQSIGYEPSADGKKILEANKEKIEQYITSKAV